jgi:hypothetical protein
VQGFVFVVTLHLDNHCMYVEDFMKMTLSSIVTLFLLTTYAFAQPTSFESRGVGGGGALFAISSSPFETGGIYVACDMGQLFHTGPQGWETVDFREIQPLKTVPVSFTANGTIAYAIDITNTPDGSEQARPTKTTDDGKTWTPFSNDPTSGSAFFIAAHPYKANILLVSDYDDLYCSIDSGKTYSNIYHTDNSSSGLHIAGSFFDGNNIYIGTNEGIIASANNGSSFAKSNNIGIPSGEYIISFSGGKRNAVTRFYCITNSTSYAGMDPIDNVMGFKGIYTLEWGLTQWVKKSNNLPTGIYPYFCGTSRTCIDTAYIGGASDQNVPAIYRTNNAGVNWQSDFITSKNMNIRTGWSGDGGDREWTYGEYPLGFSVSPLDVNRVMFSDFGFLHHVIEYGYYWMQAYTDYNKTHEPDQLTPKGDNYKSIGLENTTCWQISWIDKDNIYGCFSDIKGVRSTDAGKSWGFNYTGHHDNSMYYLTKNVSNSTLYAATSTVHDIYQSTYLTDAKIDNGKGKVVFSIDNGASWQTLHDFQHPVIWLATDPQNSNRLYASVIHSTQGGIFVSNNIQNGASCTWTKLANPPRTEGHPFNIRVLNDGSLLCSYSGRRTTNFTPSSGVFLSTDGGTTWQDRSDAGMQYWTKDVIIDPHDPTQNTWYAGVFSGWGGAANNKGGLYKTTNRGTSWTKVHSEMRVTSATFSPSNPDVMYFTSETNGLYYSENRRSANPTFIQVANYPFRQPERVFYNPYDSAEVWVTSFGNGMRVSPGPIIIDVPKRVTLISPQNGDTDQTSSVKLSWNEAEFAKDYEVHLSKDSIFSSPNQNTTTLTSSSIAVSRGTIYYWRVRGRNGTTFGQWSDTWKFVTKPSPPAAPKITYPGNLEEDVPTDIVITWDSAKTTDSYRLELSITSSFTTSLIDTAGLTDLSFRIIGLSKGTKYYVSVQGKNRTGAGSKAIHSFITEGVTSVPTAILLLSPENNSSPQTLFGQVKFDWFAIEPVSNYYIQISVDSSFDSIVFEDSTLTQAQAEFRAEPKTAYWWRVSARNSKGWGPWSQTWKFFNIIELDWSVADQEDIKLSCTASPNPASGNVTFSVDNPLDFSQGALTISDVTGKIIYSLSVGLTNGKNIYYWNADSHPNGIYFYRLTSNSTTLSGVLIIRR